MRNLLDCCIVAGLACILSCGNGEDDGSEQELHDLALANDAYKSWTPFPGQTMLMKSGDHSGAFVRSYYNDIAGAAIAKWSGSFPDGAIMVKEQFEDEAGTKPVGHTVMWKVEGFDGEHGDWYWAAFGADGAAQRSGQIADCSGCHQATAATADWVRTPFLTP